MTSNDSGAFRFQLLGEVAGWRGPVRLDFGSAHRRTVLSVLALAPDTVVSREELIDALWGERPPASASGSIYTYVSNLRQALGGRRGGRSGHDLIESVGSGYSLRVSPDCVDVHRFDQLRAEAQRAFNAGEPGALATLDEALQLWRGKALSGLTGPFAEMQRTRLDEFRLATLEQRAEIGLLAGRHAEVIADLTALTKEYPLRETLRGLLMRALHESGRGIEALMVYADLRDMLIEASGTEPSPALDTLRAEILSRGPMTLPVDGRTPVPPEMPAPAPGPVPRHTRTALFVGRQELLDLVRRAMTRTTTGQGAALLIQGEAGIGKSALLAEALAEVAPGCRIAWAAADELGARTPLRLITDCLAAFAQVAAARLGTGLDLSGQVPEEQFVPLVRQLCSGGPLLLVADDLQWADEASLAVWRRLIRLTEELPLLLVGACRKLPGRAGLEQIRLDLAVRGDPVIDLGPLPDPAVHALVEQLVGAPPGRELRQLAGRAAGNPCYVRELVGELVAAGQVVVDGVEAYLDAAADQIPPAVAVRISDHLAVLSAGTQEALRWAALLGADFTLSDIAAAADRSIAELADAVDEALLAGFLVETEEWLTFRHPLVQDTLYQQIPASTRGALHRQIAELLADSGTPASRVGAQLSAAKVPVDQWVSDWLSDNIGFIAAESPHVAVDLLRHAVSHSSLPPIMRERLTVTLARMLFFLGQDPSTEARLALTRTQDSECAAELRWMLAYVQLRRGHRLEAGEEVRRTLADDSVSAQWRSRHQKLRELLDRGQQGLPVLAVTRLLDGDAQSGDELLPVLRRTASARAVPGEVHLAGAVHCYWVGNWPEVTAEIRTVLRSVPETSSYLLRTPGAMLLVSGLGATIAAHRGEADHARGYLRTATQHAFPAGADDSDPDAAGFLMAATALLAEQEGQLEQALDALTPILDPYYPAAVRHQWLPQLARLAMAAGDHERAQHALHAVQADADGAESAAVSAHCLGLVHEDPDQILSAAAYYRTADRVVQLGRTLEDAAVLLAAAGRLDEARTAFRSALTGYTRMGASGDVRRAEERIRPYGIRRANPVAAGQ